MDPPRLHRAFLFLVIGSLGLSALLGISALVLDTGFGPLQERTLATAASLALFSILALACAWAWDRRKRRPVAIAGLVVGALTFPAYLAEIWVRHPGVLFEKTMGVGTAWDVYLATVCLLSLARLRKGWDWVNIAAHVTGCLLALFWTIGFVGEVEDEIFWRTMGVLLILFLCAAICVPILHRLSAIPPERAITTVLKLKLECPRCGRAQVLPAGAAACAGCGLGIHIEITEERCAHCGYVLYKLTSDRCPECGTPIAAATPAP